MPVPVKKMTKTQLAVIIENYETGARNIHARKLGLGYAALKSAHEAPCGNGELQVRADGGWAARRAPKETHIEPTVHLPDGSLYSFRPGMLAHCTTMSPHRFAVGWAPQACILWPVWLLLYLTA